jgi:hypothetical protein
MKLFLDWSSYKDAGMGDAYADIPKSGGDYAKAIAVCIGSRACEHKDRGVMCPSYRVTDKAELSTGGRVKLLKAALNGELGQMPFNHPELARAMDLCVSCKGCKRECENEVDMALIKAEFLAQRYQHEAMPLRNRLFAHIPKVLALSPFVGTLIRLRNKSSLLRYLGEKWLNITAKVALPEPARLAFKSTQKISESSVPDIVLFVDTFTRYFTPNAADSAIAVLSAAGYSVQVLEAADSSAPPLCCGRSYLANGMIEQAQQQAKRLFDAVSPFIENGSWVVGLEPSCILSLRDEHLKLHLGEQSRSMAQRVLLFEEFIAREKTAKRWTLEFKPLANAQVLVHGHCHQKAVGAIKSMRKVLRLIPEINATQIESSCCGMAGQFGLEAEHAEISHKMAEQGLYPAIESAPDAIVVANGFSCQQQIINGGFNKPLHIAEILHQAIDRA